MFVCTSRFILAFRLVHVHLCAHSHVYLLHTHISMHIWICIRRSVFSCVSILLFGCAQFVVFIDLFTSVLLCICILACPFVLLVLALFLCLYCYVIHIYIYIYAHAYLYIYIYTHKYICTYTRRNAHIFHSQTSNGCLERPTLASLGLPRTLSIVLRVLFELLCQLWENRSAPGIWRPASWRRCG